MKHILVCVKAVPVSTSVQVDGQYRLARDGVSLQWNIADESALEAALSLKDKDGTVTVLTMGPAKLEEHLKELLARGADQAVLVSDPCMAGADTRATAAALKAAAEKLGPCDLILCGRRAIDGETGHVPAQLAAALEIGCVSDAEQLTREGDTLMISRRLEDGVQLLRAEGPLVVSLCEYSYRLRRPGILSLRKAQSKSVTKLSAEDLGLGAEDCGLQGSLTKVVAMKQTFPGLRQGPRTTDLSAGIAQMTAMIREAQP